MTRRVDTSSTTYMAKFMRRHWSSRGTSWTKFVWSSISRTDVGETVLRSFIRTWMAESTKVGMHVRSSKTRVIFQHMWMTSKWMNISRIWLPCGRNWWPTLILENWHHFLTMYIWDVPKRECKPNGTIIEQQKKMFESHVFCWNNWKVTR